MSRVTSFSEWLLRQAFIWGGLACLAFYAFIVSNAAEGSILERYFTGHPIAYCTTALFFVGVAVLVIKLLGLVLQFATVERVQLPETDTAGQTVEDTPALLNRLQDESETMQSSYIVRRFRDALEYIQRRGSADSLEQHLHHLEDNDYSRMHHGYAMVRIILSTIPILGFLGTVIGITLAIGKMNLTGVAIDKSLPEVVAGLSIAFDTTALALVLATVLLFAKYCVERVEMSLLTAVDESAAHQLVGRFQQFGSDKDPHLASVRRMSEELLTTVQTGMVTQADLMRQAFEQSSQQWSDILKDTAATLDEALSGAVVEGMTRHATALNFGVQKQTQKLEGTLIRHAELLNEGLENYAATVSKSLEDHTLTLTTGLENYSQTMTSGLQDHTLAITTSLVDHTVAMTTGRKEHTVAMTTGMSEHTVAMTTSMEEHRTTLIEAEQQLAQENRIHSSDVQSAIGEAIIIATDRQENLIQQSETMLKEMQTSLVESAGSAVAQQEQLIRQGDILLQVVEATGQVKQLEEALNSNLKSLSASHNFQQTAAGLSAALQLMSIHLVGKPLTTAEEIELAHSEQNRAA